MGRATTPIKAKPNADPQGTGYGCAANAATLSARITAAFSADELRTWKRNHETMIAEVRQQGWSRSIELLCSSQMVPRLANDIVALIEDRRAFWARFDAEFPDRVRVSLDGLRHDLTRLRRDCAPGSPLDIVIIALAQTVRRFFDAVEQFDLTTLRLIPIGWRLNPPLEACANQSASDRTLAASYSIPLQGEFAAYLPQPSDCKDT